MKAVSKVTRRLFTFFLTKIHEHILLSLFVTPPYRQLTSSKQFTKINRIIKIFQFYMEVFPAWVDLYSDKQERWIAKR